MCSKGILPICLLFCKAAQFVRIYQPARSLLTTATAPVFSYSANIDSPVPNSLKMMVPTNRQIHCGHCDRYRMLEEANNRRGIILVSWTARNTRKEKKRMYEDFMQENCIVCHLLFSYLPVWKFSAAQSGKLIHTLCPRSANFRSKILIWFQWILVFTSLWKERLQRTSRYLQTSAFGK